MRRAGALAIMLIIIWSSESVTAQAAGTAAGVMRRVLLFVEADSGAGYTKKQLVIVSRSLALALHEGAPDVVVLEKVQDPLPGDDAGKADAAARSGADAWLWVNIEGSGALAVLHVRSYDTVYKQGIDTLVRTGEVPMPDPPRETWDGIVALVREKYAPIDVSSVAKMARTAQLSLHALPGTVVSLLPGPTTRIDSSGTVSITVDSPAQYKVRAVLPEHATWNGEILVQGDTDFSLDQQPGARWALETGASELSVPTFDAMLFIRPGLFFIRAGLTTYLATLALNQDMVFDSRPLMRLSLASGFFLNSDDSPVRLYVASDLFVRIVHATGSRPFVDPVAPYGLRLILGAEFLSSPRSHLYLEWTPTMYVTPNPWLFLLSLGPNPAPGYHFTSVSVEQLCALTFGIRWYP